MALDHLTNAVYGAATRYARDAGEHFGALNPAQFKPSKHGMVPEMPDHYHDTARNIDSTARVMAEQENPEAQNRRLDPHKPQAGPLMLREPLANAYSREYEKAYVGDTPTPGVPDKSRGQRPTFFDDGPLW